MRKTFFAFAFFLQLFALSLLNAQNYTIVQWNVETFFDGNNDGIEYQEFQKSSKWGNSAYEKRLSLLVQGIKKLNADIYVFEEIENRGIIYDISNQLAGFSWDESQNWNYASFAKNSGDSIGCAVLSKFPLGDITIHNLDARDVEQSQPSMRPIMRMTVNIDGKQLVLFVNHWKSKSGGAEESEVWRNLQEDNLARLVQKETEKGNAVICAGDFNRDISEFNILSMNEEINNIAFRMKNGKTVTVTSPWIKNGTFLTPGSYYFNDDWERIDHIFYSGSLKEKSFSPIQDDLWCSEDGKPVPYKIYTGTGFSDHLPVRLIFSLE